MVLTARDERDNGSFDDHADLINVDSNQIQSARMAKVTKPVVP